MEDFPSGAGGELDSLHLSLIENNMEFGYNKGEEEIVVNEEGDSATSSSTSAPTGYEIPSSPFLLGQEAQEQEVVQAEGESSAYLAGNNDSFTELSLPNPSDESDVNNIAASNNTFSSSTASFEKSGTVHESAPSTSSVAGFVADVDKQESTKGESETSKEAVVPASTAAVEEPRRNSVELRLQNVVGRQSRSASKPPPASIMTSKPPLRTEDSSSSPRFYDIDGGVGNARMQSHRDLIPIIPMETSLIYGPSHDASLILNDIKQEEVKTATSVALSDAPSSIGKDSGTPASASSWLSKTPSVIDEPKFQLVFPNPADIPADLASTKRNFEFHDLFPDLDPLDRLVDDYTCAWLTDMLLHGRMYVTQNSVCFYTKVIWTYQCVIPIADILSIEKKVVGRLFDNALEIITKDKSYYFTSFLSRNHAYDLIVKVISGYPNSSVELKPSAAIYVEPYKRTSSKSSLVAEGRRSRSMGSMDEPPPAAFKVFELSKSNIGMLDGGKSGGVGLAEIVSPTSLSGSTPFSDTAGPPEISSSSGASTAATAGPSISEHATFSSPTSSEKNGPSSASILPSAPSSSKKFIVHQKHKVTNPTAAEIANTSTRIAPHFSSPPKPTPQQQKTKPVLAIASAATNTTPTFVPYECPCVTSIHASQNKCLDTTVSLSVMESWQYLYSFESLHMAFCHKLWTKLEFTGIKGSDWLPPDSDFSPSSSVFNVSTVNNPATFSSLQVGWRRKIEYTRPIANPVGAKFSKVLIDERILALSDKHVCIESTSSTPSAPSGDCFQVRTRFCILAHSAPSTSRLITSCCVEYVKSTWMKVILDTAVPGGVKDYQTAMAKELDLYIKSGGIPKQEQSSSDQQSKQTISGQQCEQSNEEQLLPTSSSLSVANPGQLYPSISSFLASRLFIILLVSIQCVLNIGLIFFIYKLNGKIDQVVLNRPVNSQNIQNAEL